MMSYSAQMQRIVREYRRSGRPWPASSRTMAEWAIATGRWKLPESAAVNRCAEDLSRAMREEYMTDPKGRRVRVKHPVTTRKNGEQTVLWDDIRTAPRAHMELAFAQRRNQIVGDCRHSRRTWTASTMHARVSYRSRSSSISPTISPSSKPSAWRDQALRRCQMGKRVVVVSESETGRNQRFRDTTTGRVMSRQEFVRSIEQGAYPKYHVRVINGIATPVSNPDGREGSNLD